MVFATADVRDVLTGLLRASGPEPDMPKCSTAVHCSGSSADSCRVRILALYSLRATTCFVSCQGPLLFFMSLLQFLLALRFYFFAVIPSSAVITCPSDNTGSLHAHAACHSNASTSRSAWFTSCHSLAHTYHALPRQGRQQQPCQAALPCFHHLPI